MSLGSGADPSMSTSHFTHSENNQINKLYSCKNVRWNIKKEVCPDITFKAVEDRLNMTGLTKFQECCKFYFAIIAKIVLLGKKSHKIEQTYKSTEVVDLKAVSSVAYKNQKLTTSVKSEKLTRASQLILL